MPFEVEMKFPVSDPSTILNQMSALGASEGETEQHADRYFNHPTRDFATTDEAFRLRSLGNKNLVTYKGPKLDLVAKTRHEIEFAYADGADTASQFAEMLLLLGFRESLTVCKTRRCFHLSWSHRDVEVVLDEVAELGLFVEIETIARNEADLADAKACVLSLAAELELQDAERRSYLQLLMESRKTS